MTAPTATAGGSGADPAAITLRLLFLNAFLLRPVSLGLGPLRWEPGAAPAVADRATELGRTLVGEYDVIALAETFTPADRERVLAGWEGRPRPAIAVGPEGGWRRDAGRTTVSSGLVTIVDGPVLVRTQQHRYTTGGHRLADADPWAAKGVLLVEVDVGLPGRIEVYSTHLCAGGGLLPVGGDRLVGTDAVRRAQAAELAAFVQAHHRPGNLAVVAGDMNVAERSAHTADPAAPHRDLATALAPAGLDDLWEGAGRGPGPTSGLDRHGAALGVLDPTDERFASDDAAPAEVTGPDGLEPSERIDRVFVQRPQPRHEVEVRDTVIRRRPFPRRADAPERHRLAHLSDHLGLHVELTLAPR